MLFRIGINIGDVLTEGGRLYGDGVNIAARLESLADPGGICISGTAREHLGNKLPLGYEYIGEREVKNIAKPVAVYKVVMESAARMPPVRPELPVLPPTKETGVPRPWLRATLVVTALLLIGAGVLVFSNVSQQSSSPPAEVATQEVSALPLPNKPSIAVLPFTNMSGDPEQEYFSDGLTDTLITDLSQLSDLFVIARHSVFTYKGQAVKVEEVSMELGVRYVVEGGVQKRGDRLRINVQLIDATTGGHIWAERYDRELQDLFAVQDELVQRIVTTLGLQVSLSERGWVRRRTTDNLEAYDFRIRGVEYYFRVTKADMALARQMFERAVELDPGYAEALQALGWTYYVAWISQWEADPQNLERAFALAQQAIALDESVSDAHALLGKLYLLKKQPAQALAALERTITLAPNNADSYYFLGSTLTGAGRPKEGIRTIHKAMQLNPRYPAFYLADLGRAHVWAGQYAEAIPILERAISRNPNWLLSHLHLVISYSELGRAQEAQTAAAAVLRLNPNFSVEAWRKMVVNTDPTVMERYAAALCQAGLE